jgi:hypothetical protein
VPEGDPKESVDVTQYRPRPFPLENDELLTESSHLQREPVSGNGIRADMGDCGEDETDHHCHPMR